MTSTSAITNIDGTWYGCGPSGQFTINLKTFKPTGNLTISVRNIRSKPVSRPAIVEVDLSGVDDLNITNCDLVQLDLKTVTTLTVTRCDLDRLDLKGVTSLAVTSCSGLDRLDLKGVTSLTVASCSGLDRLDLKGVNSLTVNSCSVDELCENNSRFALTGRFTRAPTGKHEHVARVRLPLKSTAIRSQEWHLQDPLPIVMGELVYRGGVPLDWLDLAGVRKLTIASEPYATRNIDLGGIRHVRHRKDLIGDLIGDNEIGSTFYDGSYINLLFRSSKRMDKIEREVGTLRADVNGLIFHSQIG
jgi:hypothetical protein